MYQRRERPLTDSEREGLRGRLDEARGGLHQGFLCVSILAVVDGLLLNALVLVAYSREWVNFKTTFYAAFTAAAILHLILAGGVALGFISWRPLRQAREALADGVAVVERLDAEAVVELNDGAVRTWSFVAVGEGRVFVVPEGLPRNWVRQEGDSLGEFRAIACVERVSTRRHSLTLRWSRHGRSSHLIKALRLNEVVPHRRGRQLLRESLARPAVLPGTLSDLPALFDAAFEHHAPTDEVNPSLWGRLQAKVEECFDLDLGPSALAEARPATASELLDVVMKRLPTGATSRRVRVVPSFRRLRDALCGELDLPRASLRPSTLLEEVLPRRGRVSRWAAVQGRLGQHSISPFGHDIGEGYGCLLLSLFLLAVVAWPLVGWVAGMARLYAVTDAAWRAVPSFRSRCSWPGCWA